MALTQSLILIRGIPGSGKTVVAKAIEYSYKASDVIHLEADQFMLDEHGNYKYNFGRVQECHNKCLQAAKEGMNHGRTVIVSNTFTRLWEISPYLEYACDLDIPIQVIDCQSMFKSEHNVPEAAMDAMKLRFVAFDLDRFLTNYMSMKKADQKIPSNPIGLINSK